MSGCITGRGFLPGRSGNPNGRPRTRGLLGALRIRVAETAPDGRTIEELLVDALLHKALNGRHPMIALAYVFDRLEGRPRQELAVKTLAEDIQSRSDEELRHYLDHGHWPGLAGQARRGHSVGSLWAARWAL